VSDIKRPGTRPGTRPSGQASGIDRFFGISVKESTVGREILAGVSTFLALSYIFIVNPAILANAGIDRSAVLFATITVSAAATLVMGLWARLPFVVAPGMEMNAYVAFYAVGALGFTWQQALGMVFWSSIIMIALTLASIRERIIDSIPESMKVGLAFSVGVFLMLIALRLGGILEYDGLMLRGFGSLLSPSAAALGLGLVCVLLLDRLKVPGAVLIAILLTAGFCHLIGAGGTSDAVGEVSGRMLSALGQLDLGVILDPRAASVILVLFVLDFYGSVAKFIGLTLNTNIMEGGRVPRRTRALLVDGVGSTAGSLTGTTSLITFVESAVGIGVGGRTGLAAVVCGLLMLSCFVVVPLLPYIPVVATTGALIFVGIKLCPSLSQMRQAPLVDRLTLVIMPLVTVATFAIDRAMLAGFAIHLVALFAARKRPDPFLAVSTALLGAGVLLQIF
jgi:AGZA family xanthine/uracil permease-like MFS transporter